MIVKKNIIKRHCEPLKAARQSSYGTGLRYASEAAKPHGRYGSRNFVASNLLRQACAFLAMTLVLCSVLSFPAHAQCSNPSGDAGVIIYNSSYDVMQYCDDTNWIAMPQPPSSILGPGLPNDSSLIGHWKFDETSGTTAVDDTGNADGTLQGGLALPANSVSGASGNAFDFDGADDQVLVTNVTGATNLNALTYSAWIYPQGWGENNEGGIFVFDYNSCGGYQIRLLNGSGEQGIRSWITSQNVANSVNNTITLNQWQHVAATFDEAWTGGDRYPRIYVNGVEVAYSNIGATFTPNLDTANCDLYIGAEYPTGAQRNYDGYIDDARLYDRALTAAEIAQCCSGTAASNLSSALVSHWKLDETSGTTASDSSGNSNNGTMQGGLDAGTDSVSGAIDTAINFNGTSDYIDVPPVDASNWSCRYGEQRTFSAWIKPSAMSDFDDIWQEGSSTYSGYISFYIDSAGDLGLTCVETGSSIWNSRYTTSAPISTDTWTHVAFTYDTEDSPDSATLYVNGVAQSVTLAHVNGGDPSAAPGNLTAAVGNCSGSTCVDNYFEGDIDDVRIYDRILSDSEISELSNLCVASKKGVIQYNETENVMQYCDGTDWIAMAPPRYEPNAVYFDGTNDYLFRASSSFTDTKQVTASFWYKRNLDDGSWNWIYDENEPGPSVGFNIIDNTTGPGANDTIMFRAYNSAGTAILMVETSVVDDEWHHYLFSIDLSDTNKRHLYVDGVSDLATINIYTDDFIDRTPVAVHVGATSSSNPDLDGSLADLWIDYDTYIDLSIEANRRKFITASGMPVNLGTDGSNPTGSAPDVFLSGDTADWHTNKGTGGGFTETGALTDATSAPGLGGACIPTISNQQSYTENGSNTSLTYSNYNVAASGSDVMLMVGVGSESGVATDCEPLSATFNGVPMTRAGYTANNNGTNCNDPGLFYMLNPPVATGDIVVTYNTSVVQRAIMAFQVDCMAGTPEVTASQGNISVNTINTDITTISDNNLVVDVLWQGNVSAGYTVTQGPGQVEQHDIASGSASGGMSTRLVDKAGQVTLGWTATTSNRQGQFLAAFPTFSCANPNGVAGQMVFNTTGNVLQYCNGGEWIGIGK